MPNPEYIPTNDPQAPDRRQQVMLCPYDRFAGIGFDLYAGRSNAFSNITPADARRLAFRLLVAADAAEAS